MSEFSDEQKAFLLAIGRINYIAAMEKKEPLTPQEYVAAVEKESERILDEILHA